MLFFFRRLMVATCVIYFESSVMTQFVTVTVTGLATVILLAVKRPFASKTRNTVEILEECSIMLINYHVFCFTDFVASAEVQHYYVGYSLVICVVLHLFLFLTGLFVANTRSNIRKLSIYCHLRKAKKQAKQHRPGKKIRQKREA